VQPQDIHALQSNTPRICPRLPQHIGKNDSQVSQSGPRHRQRSHEATPAQHSKHNEHANNTGASTNSTGPYYTQRYPTANLDTPQNIIQPAHPIQIPNAPLIIAEDEKSIANVFCFGAFADKRNGVVYNNLTRLFPFMLLDGSVYFFIMYHYETNEILATPVVGLDNKSIFKAYKMQFDNLTSKGYKPKINIMDNQATKHIKAFLMD
jgi:hypothetical protein